MSSLDYETEDLAKRNGASLLALQIQMLQRDYNMTVDRHTKEIMALRNTLTQAEKIGLKVLSAEDRGRKQMSVAQLIDGTNEPTA